MARTTKAQLEAELTAALLRISYLEAQLAEGAALVEYLSRPEAKRPQSTVALPRGYRMLVIDGIERFCSQDFAYLSQVAKKTKLARPAASVQIH